MDEMTSSQLKGIRRTLIQHGAHLSVLIAFAHAVAKTVEKPGEVQTELLQILRPADVAAQRELLRPEEFSEHVDMLLGELLQALRRPAG